jgi:acyl carrier protein
MTVSFACTRPALAELHDIFRDVLRDRTLEIGVHSTPDDLPGWDSMAQISLIVEIECRFGIRFEPSEVEELCSVAALLQAIEVRRAAAPA